LDIFADGTDLFSTCGDSADEFLDMGN